jgi:catechol 2,3-dioxygenase-like lactoylglutathione lyase family enzyme
VTLHHVELWVPDLGRAVASWGWLLGELGYEQFQDCEHERCRPGLNHLAFHVANRQRLDELTSGSTAHGWRLMFADRHPHAGGPDHVAAYLENDDGYEVELVVP